MELFKSRTRVAYTNAVGDKVYPVIVDIKRGIKSTEEIQFMSSDINTGILSVAFIQGNENYNVSGAEVVCSVMRPDASTLDIPCTIVENNIVEVPLGINGTSQDGIYSFDFKVFKGGNKVVGTPIMNYSVSLSISNDNAVLEDDRLPVLTMLMTQITTLKNETNDVISTANTAIQNANKATDNTKLAISNAQSATQKAEEVITRVNNAIASGTQDLEVKEARDGEVSLKARLDRDIEKAKQVYVTVEGSHISTDSSVGYAKDVEILGNTIQDASNLADIRSVGDKVDGQELYEIPVLSCGKNLLPPFENWTLGGNVKLTGKNEVTQIQTTVYGDRIISPYINIDSSKSYVISKLPVSLDRYVYQLQLYEFDKNLQQIGSIRYIATSSFTILDERTKYIRLIFNTGESISGTYVFKDIQLEEGTVATPYEPYVEDKLTILSPVQLEKVGDVRDRIICKDGVWGVEKNVGTFNDFLNCTLSVWGGQNTDTGIAFYITSDLHNQNVNAIVSNKFLHGDPANNKNNFVGDSYRTYIFRGRVPKNNLSSENATGVKEYLHSIGAYVKYVVATPQFIPLPHSQQVKLRTFANKTNISFGCEIEGTIKAQVPKSLGATVNTHTEQIRSLNNELNRVKKLEESTVSTVATESDFTTVEATSGGYFEDVKLEGKTLVNLCGGKTNLFSSGRIDYPFINDADKTQFIARCEPNKTYTILKSKPTNRFVIKQTDKLEVGNTAYYLNGLADDSTNTLITVTTKDNANFLWIYVSNGIIDCDVVVLEGDHTQNPPAYFEGLKSVGQSATTLEDGADEIVVSSVKGDGNLFDGELFSGWVSNGVVNQVKLGSSDNVITNYIKVKPNQDYANNFLFNYVWIFDRNRKFIKLINKTSPINVENGEYAIFGRSVAKTDIPNIDMSKIQIVNGTQISEYTPHQSDKKPLLYYNNETQTWEKPILREWDSIEKHADGKYYYHQRSGEVVFDGSESWAIFNTMNQNDTLAFHVTINIGAVSSTVNNTVCDKFTWKDVYVNPSNGEGHNIHLNSIRFSILKSKLSTQDEQGFKQWLQANNVTVVYQLAQEKVYECTNIDLITYANETNYIVSSGAIAPKSILKVHNNISNVVKILQEKVSLLESNVKASQEVQDMMILETDMRMLDIELALMEFIPMTLNLGGSIMLRSTTYFNFVKNHIINETYEKEYLENVMNKYLATGRINQDEYDELYKMLYPPVYDIELPIEL